MHLGCNGYIIFKNEPDVNTLHAKKFFFRIICGM